MSVMLTSFVKGQSTAGYDAMLAQVGASLQQSPGFILHMAFPAEDAWKIVEVWESEKAAKEFYARTIAPRLPPDLRPKLSFQPLHSVVHTTA